MKNTIPKLSMITEIKELTNGLQDKSKQLKTISNVLDKIYEMGDK